MRHTFEARQWVPCPRPLVFLFFADPANLPLLTPAWQQAKVEEIRYAPAPPRPVEAWPLHGLVAGPGTQIVFSFRPFPLLPVRWQWQAAIVEFEWDTMFCDEQMQGPFLHWRHTHTLESIKVENVDGTLIHDHVEYELPLGPMGDAANLLGVKQQMSALFRYRQQKTIELLRKRKQKLGMV